MENPIIEQNNGGNVFVYITATTTIKPGIKYNADYMLIFYMDKETSEWKVDIEVQEMSGFEFNGTWYAHPGWTSEPKPDWDNYKEKLIKYNKFLEYKQLSDSVEKLFNVDMDAVACDKLEASIKQMGIKEFINKYSGFKLQ